jgi:hypothetical protein
MAKIEGSIAAIGNRRLLIRHVPAWQCLPATD